MRPINSLTATRGFAALLVVVFHYGCTVFPFNQAEHFFRNGNLAVNYFFVLSGFVMYSAYSQRQITYGYFIRRRFARIYPAYLLAVLLAVVPVLVNWPAGRAPARPSDAAADSHQRLHALSRRRARRKPPPVSPR